MANIKTLKQAREDKGWSQNELSIRSGVSQTYISDLEAGRMTNPTINVVSKLCAALKCRQLDFSQSEAA